MTDPMLPDPTPDGSTALPEPPAPPTPPTGAPPPPAAPVPTSAPARPLRSRYVIAVLLVAVAVTVSGLAFWAGLEATDFAAKSFDHTDVPGTLTLDLHPATWHVYSEGQVNVTAIRVTDAAGNRIPVTRSSTGASYKSGTTTTEIGRFTIRPRLQGGPTRIRITGTSSGDPNDRVMVGEFDIPSFIRFQQYGVGALLIVNTGAALAIVIVPIIRRRRHTT